MCFKSITQPNLYLMKTSSTSSTDISASLTIKYIVMGIIVAIAVAMIVLIVIESINIGSDSLKKITSYAMVLMTSVCLMFVTSSMFDTNRKNREREELFETIREGMKERRNTK